MSSTVGSEEREQGSGGLIENVSKLQITLHEISGFCVAPLSVVVMGNNGLGFGFALSGQRHWTEMQSRPGA